MNLKSQPSIYPKRYKKTKTNMLFQLPPEIMEIVLDNLHQRELLQISQINKYFRHLTLLRQYSVISIDSSPKLFQRDTKSLNDFQELRGVYQLDSYSIRAVNISSVYCLKLFFKTLIENPQYGGYIKIFHVEHLPDIPDLHVVEFLQRVLPLMNRLKEFHWNHSYPVSMKLLQYNLELTAVSGNILCDNINMDAYPLLNEAVLTVTDFHLPLRKLTIKNVDLNNISVNTTLLKSLTIENCSNEKDFLIKLDAPRLEDLSLSIEDQPFFAKMFSQLHLKSLKLSIPEQCEMLKVSHILNFLNKDISRLKISNQPDSHSYKILPKFNNLDYLHLSVLEKDIYKLLSSLTKKLRFLSLNVLEATERRNCLIASEFWECSMIDENQLKYTDFTLEYHRKLDRLKWLRFQGNDTTYIFECNESEPIIFRDGFYHYFDRIVNTLI